MLDDLYREIILDHYRSPRNRGKLEHPDVQVRGNNPVCGDEVVLDLNVADGTIAEVAYAGNGCSISQASASIMTQSLRGRSLDEALELVQQMEAMMKGGSAPEAEGLEDLEALEGVRKFPARVKCALLGWETLKESIQKYRLEHKA